LIHKKHHEHTRGIEISIVEDANITISIWDMARQEEFHIFHDYIMPDLGDVMSPCYFLFVFNLIVQKNGHDMHHH
jgi:GTPase SAR1 family protein